MFKVLRTTVGYYQIVIKGWKILYIGVIRHIVYLNRRMSRRTQKIYLKIEGICNIIIRNASQTKMIVSSIVL